MEGGVWVIGEKGEGIKMHKLPVIIVMGYKV